MDASWSDLAADLRRRSAETSSPFRQSAEEVAALAASIGEGAFGRPLFGWVAMWDLCIQQTDLEPYGGPYLRISPLGSGDVAFRFVDTHRTERQWGREVRSGQVAPTFERFVRQLHWVGGSAG